MLHQMLLTGETVSILLTELVLIRIKQLVELQAQLICIGSEVVMQILPYLIVKIMDRILRLHRILTLV